MRPLGALVGLIIGIGAVATTIWASRYAPWVEQKVYKTRWDEWEEKSQAATKKQHEDETKEEEEPGRTQLPGKEPATDLGEGPLPEDRARWSGCSSSARWPSVRSKSTPFGSRTSATRLSF